MTEITETELIDADKSPTDAIKAVIATVRDEHNISQVTETLAQHTGFDEWAVSVTAELQKEDK